MASDKTFCVGPDKVIVSGTAQTPCHEAGSTDVYATRRINTLPPLTADVSGTPLERGPHIEIGNQESPLNPDAPLPLLIIKVTARCNLNCGYCYEFNLADQTWRHSPAMMSDAVWENILFRVKRHCDWSGQRSVRFSLHGGEPCLLGPKRFNALCIRARRYLEDINVKFSLQTNGTLLNQEWADTLAANDVNVGISLDGPKEVNDVFRIDHLGRGSYERVRAGIEMLKASEVSFGLLTVIQLGANPISIHRHFLDLGCKSLSYLMPDYTYDTIGDLHSRFGPTPCADYLIPIFDDWWFNSTIDIHIRNFWDMSRLIMGGDSHVDALGNRPLYFLVVNSSGDIEGLDVLKACDDGFIKTGLNVRDADFRDLARTDTIHSRMIFGRLPLPDVCRHCQERDTCGGGYHPHRYSRQRSFNNPSIWCADLLRLFTHMRARLGVSVEETQTRRKTLQLMNKRAITG